MYIPKAFAQHDNQALHALIRDNPLATLVTAAAGNVEANHVPVILDPERGANGTLRFHLARANPAVEALAAGETLMVFNGAQTYISPDWYANPQLVPTWNYAVVHVRGKAKAMDAQALRRLLEDLSASQESRLLPKPPWTIHKLPEVLIEKLLGVIIGFELPIAHMEGKWKVSQNRTAEDRAGVIAALDALGEDMHRHMAAIMRTLD